MATKRSAPERNRKPAATSVETVDRTEATLDAVEEKVLRMRRGYGASDDLVLEFHGQDRPDVAAKLREIELRALEMSGRLDELRREAMPDPSSAKEKIIARLADKTPSSES